MASLFSTLLLLVMLEVNSAHAGGSSPTPFSPAVTGTVKDAGGQTYSVTGGSVVYASVGAEVLDPGARLTFAISAEVTGLSTTGTASFNLTGTSGGQTINVDGNVVISGMVSAQDIPVTCPPSCNSAIPLFFVGGSSATVKIADAPSLITPTFDLESPYFNPWGHPIILAAQDGSVVMVTTYETGTIQWDGTRTGGAVSGTLSGSPVTGTLGIVSHENEDLVAGTASDSGTIALSGMSPALLNVQGTYTGTSAIPSIGASDCSVDTGFPGTCTQTGFNSTGQVSMQNTQIAVTGSYSTVWAIPALSYGSALTLSYSTLPDPPIACTPATIQANPGDWPTLGLKGQASFSTPNATNTISFYATQRDAVPSAWLTGGCVGQDAGSFSRLSVTRVAYSVDGGPLQNATFSFTKHGEFECSTDTSMTLMDDWRSCAGSLTVVQMWSGSITFTVMPTGLHTVTLEAWGQDGVGPFKMGISVTHTLSLYAGQPFVIEAANLAGMPIVVTTAGLEPMLTTKGTVMIPVSQTYRTVVPQSGLIEGSFFANGQITISAPATSDSWGFQLENTPQVTQHLEIGGP